MLLSAKGNKTRNLCALMQRRALSVTQTLCIQWCWSGTRRSDTSGPQGRCRLGPRSGGSWAASRCADGSHCRYRPAGRTRCTGGPGLASGNTEFLLRYWVTLALTCHMSTMCSLQADFDTKRRTSALCIVRFLTFDLLADCHREVEEPDGEQQLETCLLKLLHFNKSSS